MSLTLQEFFFGQKVYAQLTPDNTSLNNGSTISTNSNGSAGGNWNTSSTSNPQFTAPSTTTYTTNSNNQTPEKSISEQDQYGNFFLGFTGDIAGDRKAWCSNPNNTTQGIYCSQISRDVLTNTFCSSYKDIKGSELMRRSKTNVGSAGQGFIKGGNLTWGCACPNGYVESGGIVRDECLVNAQGTLGINCGPEQLKRGTCTWNINQTLGIRSSDTTPNPTGLLQDLVLASTSFVGTLIVIALIVMGWKYVQGGFDESSTGDLKGNIKKLLIGLLLVIGSYTIIRLIQYVARGY